MKRLAWIAGLVGLSFAAVGARAQEAAGNWLGILQVGGAQLRLAVHLQKGADGAYSGTLDSVDQGATGIPLSAVAVSGGVLSFEVPKVHGRSKAAGMGPKPPGSGPGARAPPFP